MHFYAFFLFLLQMTIFSLVAVVFCCSTCIVYALNELRVHIVRMMRVSVCVCLMHICVNCCIVLIFSNTYVRYSLYSYSYEQQNNLKYCFVWPIFHRFTSNKSIKNKQQHTILPVNIPFCCISFIVYMKIHLINLSLLPSYFYHFLCFLYFIDMNFHLVHSRIVDSMDVILSHFNDKFVTFHIVVYLIFQLNF